jgi:hypothetical protein
MSRLFAASWRKSGVKCAIASSESRGSAHLQLPIRQKHLDLTPEVGWIGTIRASIQPTSAPRLYGYPRNATDARA